MENTETFTTVKETLKVRQEQIFQLDKDKQKVSKMCRTLLDFVSQSLYDNGMSLEDRREIKHETIDLLSRIDNEIELHNKCQQQLMEFEDRHYDNREPEDIELT